MVYGGMCYKLLYRSSVMNCYNYFRRPIHAWLNDNIVIRNGKKLAISYDYDGNKLRCKYSGSKFG